MIHNANDSYYVSCSDGIWKKIKKNVTLHEERCNCLTKYVIDLYRENAKAIESEARDPFGGNVYYVTMQITFPIPEFARKERNLHYLYVDPCYARATVVRAVS